MYGTSHQSTRPTRVVLRDGERRTIRARRPARGAEERRAINEWAGLR